MFVPNYTGETIEEAIQKGLTELNSSRDSVKIEIIEEAKKGFLGIGKKEAIVKLEKLEPVTDSSVTSAPITEQVASKTQEVPLVNQKKPELGQQTDTDALVELGEYLVAMAQEMGIETTVHQEMKGNVVTYHLETDKQGMLIGKHGKVLNALQYLAQVYIHRAADKKISVVVNVGDYREKRLAIVERLAEHTASKVKQTGQAVFLDPMPAFERKQVHAALAKLPYVKTHSEGEEPYRYLVVEPVKNVL